MKYEFNKNVINSSISQKYNPNSYKNTNVISNNSYATKNKNKVNFLIKEEVKESNFEKLLQEEGEVMVDVLFQNRKINFEKLSKEQQDAFNYYNEHHQLLLKNPSFTILPDINKLKPLKGTGILLGRNAFSKQKTHKKKLFK